MCKYRYESKGRSLDTEQCIFPELFAKYRNKFSNDLLIDEEGYCIFHSKNNKWKIDNGFKEKLFELIDLFSTINKTLDSQDRNYLLSGFQFPNYDLLRFDKTEFIGSVDMSHCIFNCRIEFQNIPIDSINIQHSIFNDKLYLNNVEIKNSIFASNTTFNNGLGFENCILNGNLLFNDCIFNNENSTYCEIGIKDCKTIHFLSFEASIIKPTFSILRSSIDYELSFNNCIIENEFMFDKVQINGNVTFIESEFTLIESKNPMMSGTQFENIELNPKGKIIFKGKKPQSNMIKDELSIHFKDSPRGLILFENFNLNKLYPKFKLQLPELEKDEVVEIGDGCRKYYCQTEIFTIKAAKATQTLILDIVKVFCNYFELQQNSNLGIEIVERSRYLIRYYYFTDEKISRDAFLEKINLTENNLWQTFSNLTKYSVNSVDDIEKWNVLIDMAGLFLKIGNYTQNRIANEGDIPKVLSSISAKAISHIDKEDGVVTKITQGESILRTDELLGLILGAKNNISNILPPIQIKMKITQNFYGDIEKVINADNFFENSKQVTAKDKKQILKEAKEIHNEQSLEVKKHKWEIFIHKWAGTISEIAAPWIKELLMPM